MQNSRMNKNSIYSISLLRIPSWLQKGREISGWIWMTSQLVVSMWNDLSISLCSTYLARCTWLKSRNSLEKWIRFIHSICDELIRISDETRIVSLQENVFYIIFKNSKLFVFGFYFKLKKKQLSTFKPFYNRIANWNRNLKTNCFVYRLIKKRDKYLYRYISSMFVPINRRFGKDFH